MVDDKNIGGKDAVSLGVYGPAKPSYSLSSGWQYYTLQFTQMEKQMKSLNL